MKKWPPPRILGLLLIAGFVLLSAVVGWTVVQIWTNVPAAKPAELRVQSKLVVAIDGQETDGSHLLTLPEGATVVPVLYVQDEHGRPLSETDMELLDVRFTLLHYQEDPRGMSSCEFSEASREAGRIYGPELSFDDSGSYEFVSMLRRRDHAAGHVDANRFHRYPAVATGHIEQPIIRLGIEVVPD